MTTLNSSEVHKQLQQLTWYCCKRITKCQQWLADTIL